MAKKLSRREKTRKRQRIERKERREQQRALQKQIDEVIAEFLPKKFEEALNVEVANLLGRAKGERRNLDDVTVVEACCNKCKTQYRKFFYRAGTYERGLLTFEMWCKIAVPRISCVCGGMVDFEFVHLAPYSRIWFDLEEGTRMLAALCLSLRDGVQVLALRNGQPPSIATANRVVNQTAVLAEVFRGGKLERVPAVVMLDGIWLKVLVPTEEEFTDKRGRRRKRMKRKKFPLLVAYGLDPVSGERWVLDWERGEDEDGESWRKLLERLLARGLNAERGLSLFVHDGSAGLEKAFEMVYFGPGVERQRCIFHKLQNVKRDVAGEEGMSRKERQQRRADVLADAAEVYRGKDEKEIRERLKEFRGKWEEKEAKAVATLEREFDRTLVYLGVLERARQRGEEWKVECLRATSALERVQRHFRQKARQVVIFHSEKGVDAAIELVIRRRGLAGRSTESWARKLEEALLAS